MTFACSDSRMCLRIHVSVGARVLTCVHARYRDPTPQRLARPGVTRQRNVLICCPRRLSPGKGARHLKKKKHDDDRAGQPEHSKPQTG